MQARMPGGTFHSGVAPRRCAYRTAHATLTEVIVESKDTLSSSSGRLYAQTQMVVGCTRVPPAGNRDDHRAGSQGTPSDGRGGSSHSGRHSGGTAPGARGQPLRGDRPP